MGNRSDRDNVARLESITQEIMEMAPDILCIIEGPKGEARIDTFTEDVLAGRYAAVKAPDSSYAMRGIQWIWFLVKTQLSDKATLLPTRTWDHFTEKSWNIHYWGVTEIKRHRHYRHPQVLILNWNGLRAEFIGCHLKSKLVIGGKSAWQAGGSAKDDFVTDAIKARIKLATEAANIRMYIDAKFEQVEKPAIFIMGDFNDGPGKEHFEREYLFFDLVSNLQGDIFFARKFLNHALFDAPEHLRWSVYFEDFIDSARNPKILLDHILFTQSLVDGSLPLCVEPHSGYVEHEIHDLINARLTNKQKTSDHKPISLKVTIENHQ